jgi:hypothetical protein
MGFQGESLWAAIPRVETRGLKPRVETPAPLGKALQAEARSAWNPEQLARSRSSSGFWVSERVQKIPGRNMLFRDPALGKKQP